MPGLDAFRKLYPAILSITSDDVERLSQGDPKIHLYLMTIYHDVLRARMRAHLEGWRYRHNPFASMDLSGWHPPVFTDVMQTQYDMTLRANGWLGIGMWNLAEEYYKIAISLAIVSNDAVAAFQNGANLALCYLAAGNCTNAFRVCDHLLEAGATQASDMYLGHNVINQASTIVRWCFAKTGKLDLLIQETHTMRGVPPKTASLDQSIFREIDDVFQAIDDTLSLRHWREEWRQLQDVVEKAQATPRDMTQHGEAGGYSAAHAALRAAHSEVQIDEPAPEGYTYVYTLVDPRDGTCRYIGQATNIEQAYIGLLRTEHFPAPEIDFGLWLVALTELGHFPGVEVLALVKEEWGQRVAEVFIVNGYRKGWPLTNSPPDNSNLPKKPLEWAWMQQNPIDQWPDNVRCAMMEKEQSQEA